MTDRSVSAATLRDWLHDGGEIALLDVSDGGPFADAHILAASNLPPGALEVTVTRLVPRRSTRVVVTDVDGRGARAVANRLRDGGYDDVRVLDGGNTAWERAGYRLFSGSNIVSKAFGELVEAECSTPHLDAHELARWQAEGREFFLVDSRPLAEYRTVSLPGGVNCPGAELVYRLPQVVTDPTVPVVVNCAGRTRSIIGSQSLRDAGLPNPVFALKNGTMGWQIAGLEVANGRSNMVPEPQSDGLSRARELAAGVAERGSIRSIDWSTLSAWRTDPGRTTYVFDVRQSDAYEFGHVPGSSHAPGGQLVQATDTFAAVRNARIVLVDDHGVQAVMTAHWMARMGWDVSVLADAADHMTERGPEQTPALVSVSPEVAMIDAAGLAALVEAGACEVIDVGESYWYRQGRIAGSWYTKRRAIPTSLERFSRDRTLVFVCASGSVSPHIAGDAVSMGFRDVRWLDGGRSAWRREGLPMEAIDMDDDDRLLSATDDMWYPPWSRKEGAREAMEEYLSWEVDLLGPVSEETYVRFRI